MIRSLFGPCLGFALLAGCESMPPAQPEAPPSAGIPLSSVLGGGGSATGQTAGSTAAETAARVEGEQRCDDFVAANRGRLAALTLEQVAREAADEGLAPVRMIRPGEAVTQDYRADRLNVRVDDAGRPVELYCG